MAIGATGLGVEDHLILQDGTFLHFRPDGLGLGVYGAIAADTQHLQQWELELPGAELEAVRQASHQEVAFAYRFRAMPGLTLERRVRLNGGAEAEEVLRFTNRGDAEYALTVGQRVDTQFKGIFEVREENGHAAMRPVNRAHGAAEARFDYVRQDNQQPLFTEYREENLSPAWLAQEADGRGRKRLHIRLPAGEAAVLRSVVRFSHPHVENLPDLPGREAWRREFGITPDMMDAQACHALCQAADDLHALMMRTPQGITLAAGLPRFMTQFGRDQLLTALKIMPSDEGHFWRREVVKGVLRFLAAHQATQERMYHPVDREGKPLEGVTPFRVESPGEIVHEVRHDELSGLGLLDRPSPLGKRPFGRYYGTVDTTPLFVAVAGEYLQATGDVALIRELEPAIRKALEWMQGPYAERDHHGFIRYRAASRYVPGGPLAHKVWKDASGSMVHGDGRSATVTAEGWPVDAWVATIEVQGYAYRAYRAAADIYAVLEQPELAAHYARQAEELGREVQEAFLTHDREGQPMYAMALVSESKDGPQVALNVHSSNPGHVLWTGVFGEEREAIAPVVASLFAPEHLWSGWGFRSLGLSEAGYDNRSGHAYHRGPVWPHEPIAEGLARYGLRDAVDRATRATYELACAAPDYSVPELVCGSAREEGKPPAILGTASRIQAWSAAAVLKAVELRREMGLAELARPHIIPWDARLAVDAEAGMMAPAAADAVIANLPQAGMEMQAGVGGRL